MSDAWKVIRDAVVGQAVRITRHESDWQFHFGGNFSIGVGVLCRLRNQTGVIITNEDDGHKFGLPAPIDAEERANAIVGSGTCISFEFDALTSDLKFEFSNDVTLDVLSNSSGYESWQAWSGSETVAIGAGDGLR
ncbi:MAG: hypothetical protein EOP62_03430 [Sphingomonadales bacterium]|nr:MAG: hypothetical protein EOP62_03430 [Sphingomonadales bacterium]